MRRKMWSPIFYLFDYFIGLHLFEIIIHLWSMRYWAVQYTGCIDDSNLFSFILRFRPVLSFLFWDLFGYGCRTKVHEVNTTPHKYSWFTVEKYFVGMDFTNVVIYFAYLYIVCFARRATRRCRPLCTILHSVWRRFFIKNTPYHWKRSVSHGWVRS